jgi:hypothetical protein
MAKLFGKLFGNSESKENNKTCSNQDFIDGAYEGLQLQTDAHRQTSKLGEEDNWDVDLNEGTLTFTFADGKIIKTAIQVIGTYNTNDNSFMWGWDHPSVPENLAQHALLAKKWGTNVNEPDYATLQISCSEDEVWKMSAVVNRLAEANGVYRGDSNGTFVFMTMDTLKVSK